MIDFGLLRKQNEARVKEMEKYTASLEDNLTNVKLSYSKYLRHCKSSGKKYEKSFEEKKILLIGGTGYLGIHLVYEFIKNSNNKVIILSRNNKKSLFEEILIEVFGKNIYSENKERIILLEGDAAKENFGVSLEAYKYLIENINIIINAATNRNVNGNYDDFYEANVKVVTNIVDFMDKTKFNVKFYHISTIGVSEGEEYNKQYALMTEDDLDLERDYGKILINKNYYITKCKAEKKVHEGLKDGKNINILRLGNIIFSSDTGIYKVNGKKSSFMELIESMVKLGIMPDDREKVLDLTFVNDAARAIRKIVCSKEESVDIKIYHLFNGQFKSFSDVADMCKNYVQIEKVNYKDMYSLLSSKYNSSELKKYVDIVVEYYLNNRGCHTTKTIVANEKTKLELRRLEMTWQTINEDNIKNMLHAMNND